MLDTNFYSNEIPIKLRVSYLQIREPVKAETCQTCFNLC